jgi:hypothetical protein
MAHLFPPRVASPATHKQTFLFIIIIPRFLHKKRWETPRTRVPKYLRFPITLKEKNIKHRKWLPSLEESDGILLRFYFFSFSPFHFCFS